MRSNIYRIIDVNLNRATEGLRVVEEICRFVLEDPKLSLAVKKLRGQLSRIIRAELQSRDAAGDVGREPYTKDEGKRADIESVFRANLKRAQEAVRCLEEFSKLIKPAYGKAFKGIRFKLYELEKQLAPKIIKAVKLDFDLYIIIDSQPASLKLLRKAIARGVKIVQLRDKYISKTEYLRAARKIARLTKKAGMTFLLNDHPKLAKLAGADGVHLGQEDLRDRPLRKVRAMLGEEAIIGISASDLKTAKRAEKQGADYIGFGPVFSTPLKPQAKVTGLKLLRRVVKLSKVPIVAIGGICPRNYKQVLATGCSRFAVIRAAKFFLL